MTSAVHKRDLCVTRCIGADDDSAPRIGEGTKPVRVLEGNHNSVVGSSPQNVSRETNVSTEAIDGDPILDPSG